MDLMGTYGVGDDELDTDEIEGDDVLGEDVLGTALVGARRRRHGRARQPRWRRQLAPGVPEPGYGVFPIPLTPQTNDGIFTNSISNIEYKAVAQVPFRGERLVATIGRSTGATAPLVFAQNGVFVGIRPQVGVLGRINLETFTKDSFGVRMVMQQATQGAEIRVFAFILPALTGTEDTIALSLEILGRVAT